MIRNAKYEAAARILEKAPLPTLQDHAGIGPAASLSERSSQAVPVLPILRTRLLA